MAHEVLFTWPHTEPREVIISGTFDQWAHTRHLTRSPNGFSGIVPVPWGEKTAFKFVVDGQWMVHDAFPTELDPAGNLNNVYTAPPAAPFMEEAVDSTAAYGASVGLVDEEGLGTSPPIDLADTVAARAGTSSAFGYVTSGLGAAIHGAVGVDPINADQIAIPTPVQTATATTEFEVPRNAASAAAWSAQEPAPGVPVHIVPVNSREHTEIPIAAGGVAGNAEPENSPSTHRAVTGRKDTPIVGDIGDGPTDAETGEPAILVNEAAGGSGEALKEQQLPIEALQKPLIEAQADIEDQPKLGTEPSAADAIPTNVETAATRGIDAQAEPVVIEKQPKLGTEPTAQSSIGAGENVMPNVETAAKLGIDAQAEPVIIEDHPKSGTEPTAKSAVDIMPNVETAAKHGIDAQAEPRIIEDQPKPGIEPRTKLPTIDTPQARTPDSDLNPASVIAEIETPAAKARVAAAEVTPGHDTPVVATEVPVKVERGKAEGVEGTEETGLPPLMGVGVETRVNGGVRPSTPKKATFPSAGSPGGSPSSSRTGTATSRKKKTSIFGKIKHLFEHDRDKDKQKEKGKK